MSALLNKSLILAAASILVNAQTPSVRDDFDCRMRNFALEFAEDIQPFRSSTTI